MTAYDFSFVKNTSIAFNATADSISFGALNAADFTITIDGNNTTLTYTNGDFVTLTGFAPAQVASGAAAAPNNIANFTFGSGTTQSRWVVGDDTSATTTDDIANTINLTGTSWVNGNNLVYGLGGADIITVPGTGNNKIFGGAGGDQINLTGTTGNNVVYGGSGLTDTADGDDAITVAGGAGSDFVYANSGNDTITATTASAAGTLNTIYLGLGNDSLNGAAAHAGNFVVYGNSGDDVANLTGHTGDATVFGGNGEADSTDGADTITVGTGSAIVYGNSGNDAITTGATAASKTLTIYAGLGNDTVTTGAGATTARATIYGNTGDDQISLAAFTGDATIFGGNNATDSSDGADTITVGNGNFTVYGNAGSDTINVTTTLATANKTVNVFTGLGNDTVNISGAHVSTSNINVTLADGNEVLNITSDTNGYLTTINNFNASNDKVNVTLNGGTAATLVVANGFVFNDGGTGGNSNGQFDVANEEGFNFASFTGDFNATNFVISGGSRLITNINGTTATTLTGGTGNDQLISGSLADTLVGGTTTDGVNKLVGNGGNDVFQYDAAVVNAANFTDASQQTISGGDGTDTLQITGTTAVTFAAADAGANLTSVEKLVLSNVSGHNITLGNAARTAGLTTVDASALTGANTITVNVSDLDAAAIITTGTGVDTITLNSDGTNVYNDSVSSGASADALTISSFNFTSGDTIAAGDGVDTLTISDAATIVDNDFTNVTSLEQLILTDANTQTITLGTAAQTAGVNTVNGTALAGANTVNVNASAYTTTGVTVTGGAGADTLVGGAAADTFTFNANGDAAGNDQVTMGGGADTALFQTADISADGDFNDANVSDIADFVFGSGGDIIDFTNLTNGDLRGNGTTIQVANGTVTAAGNDTGIYVATNTFANTEAGITAGMSGVTLANTEIMYLLFSDGTNGYLARITSDATAAIQAADTIQFVTEFTGITSFASFTAAQLDGNFADFAA